MISLVRPTLARALAAAALALFAAGGAVAARERLAPTVLVLPGLKLGGEAVPACAAEAALRAWVAERAKARGERPVTLVAEDATEKALETATLGELGARVDEDATVARVIAVGQAPDLVERVDRAARARRGEIDLPVVIAVDADVVKGRIARLKESGDRAPVSARLDLERHDVVPEVPGRYLDAEGAIAAVDRAARSDAPARAVVIPVASLAPRFTRESLQGLDVHAVVAEYDTYFSRVKDQARRGQNIDVAAAKLDGLVLMPGELFSFNDAVGDRSPENGFQRSWEIHKGEMVEGVGGGTCQVASTVYAAAFFAGLDVLQRLPHSRPSAYIPMGLDATVVYPDVDMKLRNPYPFPIALHAKVDGNRLHVELLGASRPVRSVELTREIVETLPYDRKLEEDARLRPGTVRVKQHGIAGYKIKRTRVVSLLDGTVKREESDDGYPPTMEIDEVPPGFDEALLPPVPGAPVIGEDSTAAPAAPAAGVDGGAAGIVFVEGPGAHAPTKWQASPPRVVTLRR